MTEFVRAQELTRALVTPALRKAVETLSGLERLVVGYHLGFVDSKGNPVREDGGKKLRPMLALLGAQAVGADPAQAVNGAVALELVHNFSLVHDDIMDRDRTRRHRETVWSVWDDATAILAGDAMHALAFETLLADGGVHATEAGHLLAATTRELIRGQTLDMDFERRQQVSLSECRAMAAAKTGVLLTCSTELPAVLTGARREQRAALATYGRNVGLAFQLVDDLLGIWGSAQTTGKPVGADLRARKKSLPVVAAMASGTSAGEQLRRMYESGELYADADAATVAHAAALVEDAGGRAWASDEAARRLKLACDALTSADLGEAPRTALLDIARYVTARDR